MLKILVVEDEPSQREYAATVLQRAGFEVSTAADGADGLAQIQARRPDLVVCDANMPEMDGLELLAKLRADPQFGNLPFVLLTAMRFDGARNEAKGLGAQEYLVKPFKAPVLVDTVRRLLNVAAPDQA